MCFDWDFMKYDCWIFVKNTLFVVLDATLKLLRIFARESTNF